MALGTPVAAAAAYSAAGGTSVTPAYPTGILATDSVLLFVGQKPAAANVNGGTVTTPTGWTLREELLAAGGYGTTIGADTGNTNLRVYSWNTPVAGQTGNLTVTVGQNDVTWAFIVRIPTGGGTLSYGSADGQRTTTPTSPMSIALTNGTTATDFQPGDIAIWAMCIPTDVTTPSQFSAQSITATGATFGTATELNEPDSTTGNDIGGYSAWAQVTSGSSTTAPTVTATLAGTLTNVRGPVVLVRVREQVQLLTQVSDNKNWVWNSNFVGAAAPSTLPTDAYWSLPAGVSYTIVGTGITDAGRPYIDFQMSGTKSGAGTFYCGFAFPDSAPNLNPSVAVGETWTTSAYFQLIAGTTPATAELQIREYSSAPAYLTGAGFSVASMTSTETRFSGTRTLTSSTVAFANGNYLQFILDNTTPSVNWTFRISGWQFEKTSTASPQWIPTSTGPVAATNVSTFYKPSVSRVLSPARYDDAEVFYGPVVSSKVTLTPSRYDNAQAFYSPTVTAGATTQNLTPSRYDNAQNFYAATVTPGAVTLTPDLYTNAQTFYGHTVTPGAVSLTPARYDNSQTFYSQTVTPGAVALTPARYDNAQTFYSATVASTYALTPARYDNAQAFYAATVVSTYALTPARYDNAQTFYSATVTPGAVTLTPARYDNSQSFFAATVTPGAVALTPARYDNSQTFYSATVTQGAVNLAPARYDNTQTFYSATVGRGAVTLTAARYDNAQDFYAATVSRGGINLTTLRYDNAQTFYAHTVTPGAVTLTPARYDNAQTFYATTVSATYSLQPALYSNSQTFYSATVSAKYTLTPALYTNSQTFYAATAAATYALTPARYDNSNAFYSVSVAASYSLTAARYDNANVFYTHTVTRGAIALSPPLLSNTNAFYPVTVTKGAVALTPARYDNANVFYPAIVARDAINLQPSLVVNNQSFYSATVSPGAAFLVPQDYVDPGYVDPGYAGPNTFSTQVFYAPTVTQITYLVPARYNNANSFYSQRVSQSQYLITLAQAKLLFEIYLLHGLATPSPLSVSSTARSAGPIEQSVAEASGVVTVTTTSEPTYPDYDPGLMITELAALHGIGQTLTVTSGTRVAGPISQVFGSTGSATTVTRQ